MLPSKGWASYEAVVFAIAERREVASGEEVEFLRSLGLVGPDGLTAEGERYFDLRVLDGDDVGARELLGRQLLEHSAEAAAIAQTLAMRGDVRRSLAETVLRRHGHGDGLTERKAGALLALMNHAGLIQYSKGRSTLRVVVEPLSERQPPDSVFISPDTPWSNRRWLKRLIAEATGFIYWFDKHWLPEGLDLLGETVEGGHVSEVRVLSVALSESQTRKANRAYRDMRRELSSRGVNFEWRFVESALVRDTHDRWIIAKDEVWNVPNLNAILSGQHSELVKSSNAAELQEMFNRLWARAPQRLPDAPANKPRAA